jgi:agmatine/peptidylarginine deiminase
VKKQLTGADFSKISFAEFPTNDTWARDHGAITILENDRKILADYCFNGWGMKFAAHEDNRLTKRLFDAGYLDGEYENHLGFVLEGGSLESDGEGTLLTTSACLLSDNRNNLTRAQIEHKLSEELGFSRFLWLNSGYLEGDDTDSHIDTLARFCNRNTIAYVKCDDTTDVHYNALKQMENELMEFKNIDGEPYNLISLPMADAIYDEGQRLPATYANFLIINGAVLMPAYNSNMDKIAETQLQKAFPDRKIISINCIPLIKQHGSLHCVTMQYF